MGWRGPLTHRQSIVWAAWLSWEWDRPGRLEQYVAAVGHEVRYSQTSRKPAYRFQDYRLTFNTAEPSTVPQESAAARTSKIKAGLGVLRRVPGSYRPPPDSGLPPVEKEERDGD